MLPIWKSGDNIYIYFDDKSIKFYPEEKLGLEPIYGLISIKPIDPTSASPL